MLGWAGVAWRDVAEMNLLGFWRKWKWKSTVALGMLCSCAQFGISTFCRG